LLIKHASNVRRRRQRSAATRGAAASSARRKISTMSGNVFAQAARQARQAARNVARS